ncbi:MAG: LamG domain-containing protein [Anaerolineae bacterium]|nr:LamG domain-containing protein [Anaerolineae bacterium]
MVSFTEMQHLDIRPCPKAFGFDGYGDFVNIPHNASLNLGKDNFTIALWVNFKDLTGEQVLLEKWVQKFPGSTGWTLTKLENNSLRFAMASGGNLEINVDTAPLRLRSGAWHHFAVSRHAGRVVLFQNGQVVASGMSALSLDSDSSLKLGHRGNPMIPQGLRTTADFI